MVSTVRNISSARFDISFEIFGQISQKIQKLPVHLLVSVSKKNKPEKKGGPGWDSNSPPPCNRAAC